MNTLKDYSVSGVKTFQGMEGLGYNATLLKNGKKIAFVIDDASGGEIVIRWEEGKQNEKQILNDLLKALPPIKISGIEIKQDEAIFIEELINNYEENKKLKQLCKTKTLFRLIGDESGTWRTLNSPYADNTKKYLTMYDNIEEIANERFEEKETEETPECLDCGSPIDEGEDYCEDCGLNHVECNEDEEDR